MSAYEHFDATHRVVVRTDDRVAACKRTLVSYLRRDATEVSVFYVDVHEKSLPNAVEALESVENDLARPTYEEEKRVGPLPEVDAAVDAVLGAMRTNGSLPLNAFGLAGPDFDCYLSGTRSHSHVAKLRVDDETRLDAIRDAVVPDGLVLPTDPVAAWEMGDDYVEISVHELCVYAEPVAGLDREERMSVTHSCNDLTGLEGLVADEASNRIRLEWSEPTSLVGRVLEAVLWRRPEELTVPPEQFDVVGAYLEQFAGGAGNGSGAQRS